MKKKKENIRGKNMHHWNNIYMANTNFAASELEAVSAQIFCADSKSDLCILSTTISKDVFF